MSTAYINLKTKEIIKSDNSEYINCDERLADIILLLNDKGYITKFSCSGHIEDLFYYEETIPIDKKSFLEENKDLELIRIEDDKILYRGIAWLGSNLYISFDKDYNFQELPKGYVIENDSNYTIRKYFPIQDENGKKYTLDEMKKNQDESIKDLYIWVKKLEYLNEKER